MTGDHEAHLEAFKATWVVGAFRPYGIQAVIRGETKMLADAVDATDGAFFAEAHNYLLGELAAAQERASIWCNNAEQEVERLRAAIVAWSLWELEQGTCPERDQAIDVLRRIAGETNKEEESSTLS